MDFLYFFIANNNCDVRLLVNGVPVESYEESDSIVRMTILNEYLLNGVNSIYLEPRFGVVSSCDPRVYFVLKEFNDEQVVTPEDGVPVGAYYYDDGDKIFLEESALINKSYHFEYSKFDFKSSLFEGYQAVSDEEAIQEALAVVGIFRKKDIDALVGYFEQYVNDISVAYNQKTSDVKSGLAQAFQNAVNAGIDDSVKYDGLVVKRYAGDRFFEVMRGEEDLIVTNDSVNGGVFRYRFLFGKKEGKFQIVR